VNEQGSASERYARQARFHGIGLAGQARLAAAKVAVVGCGALGSAVIDLLARGGAGELRIADRDVVEIGDLHRQLLFDESDASARLPKAVAAAQAVGRINSAVRVTPRVIDVAPDNVEGFVSGADVVVDGTDNLETRYLLNDACVRLGIPWVYGGAIGSTGMSMTIVPGDTPCLRCLFPDVSVARTMETCETAGVLASTVVTVAAHQWTEVVKLIVGARGELSRGLLALDVWTNDHTLVSGIQRRSDCPCCAQGRYDFLEARSTSRSATLCGRNAIQIRPGVPVRVDLAGLGRRLATVGPVVVNDFLVRFSVGPHELTVFADGRAFVAGTSDPAEARSVYARWVGA